MSTVSLLDVLNFFVFVVGILLVLLAPRIESERIWHHFVRDMGIAFIVAPLVTFSYELRARTVWDRANIESILDTIMGEVTSKDAWDEIKSAVIQRRLIRQDVQINLKILPREDQVQCPPTVVRVDYAYNLYGLQSKSWRTTVQHSLERYVSDQGDDIPRFEHIAVNGQTYYPRDLVDGVSADKVVTMKEGVALLDVPLEPVGKQPTRVVTRRLDLANVPGVYTLVMSELTQRVTVTLDDIPSEIEPEVEFITDRAKANTIPGGGSNYYFKGIMLPGQSVQIRFKIAKKH